MKTKKIDARRYFVDKKFIYGVVGTVVMWGAVPAFLLTSFALALSGFMHELFPKRTPTVMEGLIDALPGITSFTGIAMLIGLMIGISSEWDAAATRRNGRVQLSGKGQAACLARIQESYAAWLKSSPVDGAGAEAERNEKGLGQQLKDLRKLLCELQSRDTASMLPPNREQHEETLAAVQTGIKGVERHERMWRERLVVLTAQRMFQCALRSLPPWLGGAPFEDRPKDSENLWPKKPANMAKSVAEAQDALQKITAAQTSMRKVEEQMAAELVTASREAKMHLQTLLERAQGLRDRLSTRLVECQTHEDRQRAYALIAKTPAGTLRAGELDAFFPKDIEPIDTELLMSVPQSFDLEDKLAELKAAVDRNVAAGSADHEVEALTQAPGGHVLPPRRPRTTR